MIAETKHSYPRTQPPRSPPRLFCRWWRQSSVEHGVHDAVHPAAHTKPQPQSLTFGLLTNRCLQSGLGNSRFERQDENPSPISFRCRGHQKSGRAQLHRRVDAAVGVPQSAFVESVEGFDRRLLYSPHSAIKCICLYHSIQSLDLFSFNHIHYFINF